MLALVLFEDQDQVQDFPNGPVTSRCPAHGSLPSQPPYCTPTSLLPGSQPAMRAAGTVIPAIAALTGDHPPGDKRDDEKGEEDLERPERGLGCPGGQERDAGASASDPPHHGLYPELAVCLPLVGLIAHHCGSVTISSAPHVIHDRAKDDDWP